MNMGQSSWRAQTLRALEAIDRRGQSKHQAKIDQGHKPGQAVYGIYSHGEFNTVFDKSLTFAHWIDDHYPTVSLFREITSETVAEFLAEKSQTCQASYVKTMLSALRKLQEGLLAQGWLHEKIVLGEWRVDDQGQPQMPRGAYALEEAQALVAAVSQGIVEYGQALRFILSSGARIDEVFHLRSDKIFVEEKRVELLGKGGKTRKIQVLDAQILSELDRSRRFVYLEKGNERVWKPGLENTVRKACDELSIERRGIHGFRGSAACELVRIKTEVMGLTEAQARRELAMWLGHNPHRTEVTYAYVPKMR
jgi:integrase